MAWTDWVQTAAVIYFAWQQNRIFKRQNEIIANQAERTAIPSKTSQAHWIERYWPTMIMVVLMALTAYDIYDRHANGASPPNIIISPLGWRYGILLLLIAASIGLVVGRLTRAKAELLGGKTAKHRTWDAVADFSIKENPSGP